VFKPQTRRNRFNRHRHEYKCGGKCLITMNYVVVVHFLIFHYLRNQQPYANLQVHISPAEVLACCLHQHRVHDWHLADALLGTWCKEEPPLLFIEDFRLHLLGTYIIQSRIQSRGKGARQQIMFVFVMAICTRRLMPSDHHHYLTNIVIFSYLFYTY
jgi:hypothetical protein